jgi:hypothetical protein
LCLTPAGLTMRLNRVPGRRRLASTMYFTPARCRRRRRRRRALGPRAGCATWCRACCWRPSATTRSAAASPPEPVPAAAAARARDSLCASGEGGGRVPGSVSGMQLSLGCGDPRLPARAGDGGAGRRRRAAARAGAAVSGRGRVGRRAASTATPRRPHVNIEGNRANGSRNATAPRRPFSGRVATAWPDGVPYNESVRWSGPGQSGLGRGSPGRCGKGPHAGSHGCARLSAAPSRARSSPTLNAAQR